MVVSKIISIILLYVGILTLHRCGAAEKKNDPAPEQEVSISIPSDWDGKSDYPSSDLGVSDAN